MGAWRLASGGFSAGIVGAATNGTQRALTKALLDTAISAAYVAGGNPKVFMVSPYAKTVFSHLHVGRQRGPAADVPPRQPLRRPLSGPLTSISVTLALSRSFPIGRWLVAGILLLAQRFPVRYPALEAGRSAAGATRQRRCQDV